MKYFISVFIMLVSFNAFSQKAIVSTLPTFQDKYAKKSGNIRFTSMSIRIGMIRNNETKMDTIRMINNGLNTVRIAIGKVPAHIEAHISSTKLAPKEEGWISIKYDAAKRNDYGFVVDRLELVTDDSIVPVKTITIQATIAEYFPPMTAEDSASIQRSKIIETSYDYGTIKQGDKVSHKFMLVNEGKRDLVIHKIKTTFSNLKSSVSKNTIAAGDTAYLSVDFDSKNKEGKDLRKLSVFMNDPARPELMLEMKGVIVKQ